MAFRDVVNQLTAGPAVFPVAQLQTIVEAVENSLAMVQGISSATGAQMKDSEAIGSNIEQIRANAQATTENVDDLEGVVKRLIQEAVVLRHEIDRFKTIEVTRRKSGFD